MLRKILMRIKNMPHRGFSVRPIFKADAITQADVNLSNRLAGQVFYTWGSANEKAEAISAHWPGILRVEIERIGLPSSLE
jgi:hypothetical protein